MKTKNEHNVLFLTTANLAMKPRLVKEIVLAKEHFTSITVMAFLVENWTDKAHVELCEKLGIQHIDIYATRKNFLVWFLASVVQRLCMCVWPLFRNNLLIASCASNKRSLMLQWELRRLQKGFKMANGRNTATLYPLYRLKKKKGIPFTFDIEDYHPGESVTWTNSEQERIRRETLMKRTLPSCSYLTTAGIPILEKTGKLLALNETHPIASIANAFFQDEFRWKEKKASEKIKLVWYSLDISANRGLEVFLPVLNEFSGEVSVCLIGNLNQGFYANFLKDYSFVSCLGPMPQETLHQRLFEYDVGLALELNNADDNRPLTITNKIYAYAQSGLYILATRTMGQTHFMEQHQVEGMLVDASSPDQIREGMQHILEHKEAILKRRRERYEKAKSMAWEHEAQKLKEIWKLVLTDAR